LGSGRADGSISEQLLHAYYTAIVADADALIDIRTGALWGYFSYAGVYDAGASDASCALAAALGLPHVLLGQPEENSLAFVAARANKMVVSAWIGGGPGLRDFRREDAARTRHVLLNAMRHLGMLPAAPIGEQAMAQASAGGVTVIRGHTILRAGAPRGMVFMHKEKRGQRVRAGEALGYVRHPFTGEKLHEIVAPRQGVMLHAGAAWPMVQDQVILAILGDPI
jgi:predicted deacylase